MGDTGFIPTKRLVVDVQENGVIRRASDGYIIGRLAHDGDPSYEELVDEREDIAALRARAEKAEAMLERIKHDGDKVLRYLVGHRCDYYNYAMSCRDRATQALAGKE